MIHRECVCILKTIPFGSAHLIENIYVIISWKAVRHNSYNMQIETNHVSSKLWRPKKKKSHSFILMIGSFNSVDWWHISLIYLYKKK